MKRIIALICFFAIIFTLVSCKKNEIPSSPEARGINTQDGEIIKLLLSPYGNEETVGLNLPARNYVSVTANGYFNPNSLKFVSDDPDIATIHYDSTALENCIYYEIEGISTGKTTVHIESADGKIRSEDIFVTVKRYISTTTQLSIEYKPYKYHTEYIDLRASRTTEKSETTTVTTTALPTTRRFNITTRPTTTATEVITEQTIPVTEIETTTRRRWWRR